MNAPVNRMMQHYADAAMASTIDYVGYCIKRMYPAGTLESQLVTWHYKEQPIDGEFHCGLATTIGGHAFITRFSVPIDAGGAKIKLACRYAADMHDNMMLKYAPK